MKCIIQHFGNRKEDAISCLVLASKLDVPKGYWVCPSSFLSLRGKPKLKKIKKNLCLTEPVQKYIEKIEKELEEKYGI